VSEFAGRVAVVTGAASGIGRALAHGLARRGARLALSDVDEDGLAATAAGIPGTQVRTDRLDVTDRAGVLAYAQQVVERFGRVNQVYNNAGIAFAGTVLDSTFDQIHRVVEVDFWGVVNGTKAFLPHLIASADGHVVNVSSLFGLLAVPGQSAYNAAKFAVRGFTESLRQEMLVGGHPVRVTCVHPGGVRTAIARNAERGPGFDDPAVVARFERTMLRLPAQRAAETILEGVRRDRARVLVGTDARVLDLLVRLVASGYQRPLARMAASRMRR